jgi:hypothetical protein
MRRPVYMFAPGLRRDPSKKRPSLGSSLRRLASGPENRERPLSPHVACRRLSGARHDGQSACLRYPGRGTVPHRVEQSRRRSDRMAETPVQLLLGSCRSRYRPHSPEDSRRGGRRSTPRLPFRQTEFRGIGRSFRKICASARRSACITNLFSAVSKTTSRSAPASVWRNSATAALAASHRSISSKFRRNRRLPVQPASPRLGMPQERAVRRCEYCARTRDSCVERSVLGSLAV